MLKRGQVNVKYQKEWTKTLFEIWFEGLSKFSALHVSAIFQRLFKFYIQYIQEYKTPQSIHLERENQIIK